MRVSTRVEYGVLALTDIAQHSENGSSVSAVEISKRQGISKKYLEQILPLLKQAGLIKAQKGLCGGYALSRRASDVKMSEVLNALDNSILEGMDYTQDAAGKELMEAVNECLWAPVNGILNDYFEKMSLSDLVLKCSESLSGGWDMYVI